MYCWCRKNIFWLSVPHCEKIARHCSNQNLLTYIMLIAENCCIKFYWLIDWFIFSQDDTVNGALATQQEKGVTQPMLLGINNSFLSKLTTLISILDCGFTESIEFLFVFCLFLGANVLINWSVDGKSIGLWCLSFCLRSRSLELSQALCVCFEFMVLLRDLSVDCFIVTSKFGSKLILYFSFFVKWLYCVTRNDVKQCVNDWKVQIIKIRNCILSFLLRLDLFTIFCFVQTCYTPEQPCCNGIHSYIEL